MQCIHACSASPVFSCSGRTRSLRFFVTLHRQVTAHGRNALSRIRIPGRPPLGSTTILCLQTGLLLHAVFSTACHTRIQHTPCARALYSRKTAALQTTRGTEHVTGRLFQGAVVLM